MIFTKDRSSFNIEALWTKRKSRVVFASKTETNAVTKIHREHISQLDWLASDSDIIHTIVVDFENNLKSIFENNRISNNIYVVSSLPNDLKLKTSKMIFSSGSIIWSFIYFDPNGFSQTSDSSSELPMYSGLA